MAADSSPSSHRIFWVWVRYHARREGAHSIFSLPGIKGPAEASAQVGASSLVPVTMGGALVVWGGNAGLGLGCSRDEAEKLCGNHLRIVQRNRVGPI